MLFGGDGGREKYFSFFCDASIAKIRPSSFLKQVSLPNNHYSSQLQPALSLVWLQRTCYTQSLPDFPREKNVCYRSFYPPVQCPGPGFSRAPRKHFIECPAKSTPFKCLRYTRKTLEISPLQEVIKAVGLAPSCRVGRLAQDLRGQGAGVVCRGQMKHGFHG